MARTLSGFVEMTMVLAIGYGSLVVSSRAAGVMFKSIPYVVAMSRESVLEPAATWLSGFSYGRRAVDYLAGLTVPEPLITYLTILTPMVLIVAIGMAALKAVERLTQ